MPLLQKYVVNREQIQCPAKPKQTVLIKNVAKTINVVVLQKNAVIQNRLVRIFRAIKHVLLQPVISLVAME